MTIHRDTDHLADPTVPGDESLSQLEQEHSLKRPDDLSLPDFLAGQRRGWTAEERERLDRSPYAVRLQKLSWRVELPALEMLFRWHMGELAGFEAQAMQEHLAEPEGRQSRLLLGSAWWRRLVDRCTQLREAGKRWQDLLGQVACSQPSPALSTVSRQERPLKHLRAGDPATLLAVLQRAFRVEAKDDQFELVVMSCDPARAGRASERS